MSSLWIETTKKIGKSKPINKNYKVDVCIIGAGICGLTTAYYLAKNGTKVIVVDKEKIGAKVSGNTTAKITLQHNLIYNYLIEEFDEDFALGYYESNREAISNIKSIIDEEKIDCDFEYVPNYVYTTQIEDFDKIQKEVEAINRLEHKRSTHDVAEFVKETELPFKIAAGIKLENQAQFHPRKYMFGLVKAIEKYGGLIFTNSLVTDVKREADVYVTYVGENENLDDDMNYSKKSEEQEYRINSKHVVLASHYPFINFPGMYFSKMYQVTSYAIALETENNLIEGMYISSNEPTLSFRTAQYGDKQLLIMAGGNHKTGFSPNSEDFYGYKFLEKKAKELFPNSKILYKWNTRDCITLDKIPYIGEFSYFKINMWVATGFNKWGMTTSNVAANIISDGILEKENKYAKIYDSTRMKPIKNKEEIMNMAEQTVKSFIANRIKIPKEDLFAIKNDNGGIIRIDGNSVGIYKDSKGEIYTVNPTCTHLGCLLTWNNVDKTWDCPCHGSRFDYTGKNIYEPAIKNLGH
ncbi:MAG: FAD-dependent oxidoreductase [Clostridia bacterium]|nr:FAD-dependent oxidoreductase [Clostridia bacterium]